MPSAAIGKLRGVDVHDGDRGGGDHQASKRGVIGEGEHARQSLERARRIRTKSCGCSLTALGAGLEGAQEASAEAVIETDKLVAGIGLVLIARLPRRILAVGIRRRRAAAMSVQRHGAREEEEEREPTPGAGDLARGRYRSTEFIPAISCAIIDNSFAVVCRASAR
jgi:hypothetical protein